MKLKTEVWLRSLIAAVITGAASTGLAALGIATANGMGIQVPQVDWKQVVIMIGSGGLVGLLSYLKQSPVPPEE